MSLVNQQQYLWEGGLERAESKDMSFQITLYYNDESEETFFESSSTDLTEDEKYHEKLLHLEDVIDFYIELDGIIA
ncbi:hypothetical protein [Flammeovirga aprica]|uniref:Uncharacterized protein n=1 Tax=Flammeovirga aprica JL-4 TaxID=694437 RepID=A0A7X9RVZ9_9BACT|nr:hypothetical protein [Flammeovirga aprica]NME69752.1 hypothetical protein [Flammeovirga aprica JL-4]